MSSLVSVIIPCYNAGLWVGEAIQSCLDQTHSPIEIIVVDDGSTDGSLDRIKSFGERVRWETGAKGGGNHARNRGFAISSGQYIQFLDADDYLLPDKIARQLRLLKQTGADVVYGDWRHRHDGQSGASRFEDVPAAGAHEDLLAALLSGWWVPSNALLFRREIVGRVGGWDESLLAAQDSDFLFSVVLASAKIIYQPGCGAIYRRYGPVTVSTGNRLRWVENRCRVFDKTSASLGAKGRLTAEYRRGLAQSYFTLARICYDLDRRKYEGIMANVLAMEPGFRPQESSIYNAVHWALGFSTAEFVASWKRRLTQR
jgi:glycosyltransferase involved in cell wall biosynthesis